MDREVYGTSQDNFESSNGFAFTRKTLYSIHNYQETEKIRKRKKLDFKLRGLGNGEIRYHEVRMCVSEKAYARSFLPRLKRVCKEKLE